jgi:hypothetical protein
MVFLVFCFFVWPIGLFKFGLSNFYRPLRAIVAMLFSICGFAGYVLLPYRLLIFSHYFPLPAWSYVVIPFLYLAGYLLYWKIDDSPLISFM